MKAVEPKVTVVSRRIKSNRSPQMTAKFSVSTDLVAGKGIPKKCRQLAVWLKPLGRWSQGVVSVSAIERGYKVRLYTSDHIYYITAIPKRYLGCVAISRKARIGEDWFRGNDLRDGKWSKATWQKILADIVSYELEPYRDPLERITVKEMQETRHAKH